MITIAIELSVACKACDTPIALNAVVPAVACPRCERELTLAPEQWKEILRAPVTDAAEMSEEERNVTVTTDDGSAVRIRFVRSSPTDPTLPARAGPDGCGVLSFIGEDAEQLGLVPPAVSEPLDLACTHCGAGLHVDGASRVVPCAHCNGQVRLPDEIWQRLHPVRPPRRFYAVIDAAQSAVVAFSFHEARVALRDAHGNLYVAGRLAARDHVEGDELDDSGVRTEEAAWSYDSELRLRWVRRFTKIGGAQAIALVPDEASLFIKAGTDGGMTLDTATGAPIKKQAPLGRLEVEIVQSHADDTFLVGSCGVVTRKTPEGDPLPLFPDEKVEQPGFFARVFGGAAAATTSVAGKNALLLPGGDLVVLEGEPHLNLVRYDRKGVKVHTRETEITDDACSNSPMQCDGDDLYVLAAQRLWRASLEKVAPLAIDGPIDAFVVLPGGDLWLFGPRGEARRVPRPP